MKHLAQRTAAAMALAGMCMPAWAEAGAAPANAPASVAAPTDGAAAGTLTLDDAVALALRQNETVSRSEAAVDKARAQARATSASGLPQVSAAGSVNRQKKSAAALGGQSIVLTPGTSKAASISATQLVDIFGKVRRARDIADAATRVQELNVARSKSEIVYQTRAAYYNVLRADGAVGVAQAAVADAQEQLRLAQANETAGTSPGFDVIRARVTLAQQQTSLVTAQDSLALAASDLNNLLGLPIDAPLRIASLSETPDRTVDIAGQTARAMEARPEILQADLGIRSNEVNVGLQRLGHYPTFAASGTYSYNFTPTGLSASKANWEAGVSVQAPLFDSGSTRAQVRAAEADVRSAKLLGQQVRRSVALQVRAAGLQVQEAADRFVVADGSVGQAEEALRIARVRYQSGVATQLEVTDAETQLVSARQSRNSARYDYYTARAAFDAAVLGRLS
ncbi:MAG TPA: TolC family protein [Armatimonadota bacterium]|jgi:outer membrane protein TolC